MKTLIKNGLLIDPANQVQAYLNLILEDGKVVAVTEEEPEADRVIDATGKLWLLVLSTFICMRTR